MAKRNVHKFRQDRAFTIDLLAEILIKKRILKDVNPLTRASSICRSNTRQDNRWGYNVRNLDFGDIDSKHNIRPKGVKDLRLYLSIKLDGICYYDEEYFDPLNELTCDIIITGSLLKDKDVICCWHLDRHISEEGDNEPEEIHPRYHFQFGGEEIL